MGKIILIYGAGLGKTILGNALADLYRSQGIACKRIHECGAQEIKKIAIENESFPGFIVITTNHAGKLIIELSLESRRIWQTIEIQGGEVLKHEDFLEMATDGLGPSFSLYGTR